MPQLNKKTEKPVPKKTAWKFNVPLLVTTAVVAVVIIGVCGFGYAYQSSKLTGQLLEKADAARAKDDYQEEAKWLGRYVRMVPGDTDVRVQFAIALDNSVADLGSLNASRDRLSNAILAVGDQAGYEDELQELRARLIKRYLQLGATWASEAERETIALAAPAGDPQALLWMAKSLGMQKEEGTLDDRDVDRFDRDADYWNWVSCQPVGEVIQLASQANVDDLGLSGMLVGACIDYPEWFDRPEQPASREALYELALGVVGRLETSSDNGHAIMLAHDFYLTREPDRAADLVVDHRGKAFKRLESYLEEAETRAEGEGEEKTNLLESERAIALNDDKAYQPSYDWRLVLKSAEVEAQRENLDVAQGVLEELVALDSELILDTQREAAFLQLARVHAQAEDWEAAADTLAAGIKALPDLLQLRIENGVVQVASAPASVRSTNSPDRDALLQSAEKSIVNLREAIDDRQGVLDGTPESAISRAMRTTRQQRLELARWQADFLDAQLEIKKGNYNAAREILEVSFESQLLLNSAQRLQAGRSLALCYGQLGLWDLSAEVVDRCITLAPNDMSLRLLSAQSWNKVGAGSKAERQLETADDGSFGFALTLAKMAAQQESTKPEASRDYYNIRKHLAEARRRYEAAPPEVREKLNGWELEVQEVVYSSTIDSSDERLDVLEKVAEKYSGVPRLQGQIAISLAAKDRMDDANRALARLKAIAESSPETDDDVVYAITQIQIAGMTGDVQGALDVANEALKRFPTAGKDISIPTALVAMQQGNVKEAYAFMKSHVDSQDLDLLVMLAGTARVLWRSDEMDDSTFNQEHADWISRLRQLEGQAGTYWRVQTIEKLLLDAEDAQIASRNVNPILVKAEQLFKDVNSRRPRWGRANALGGAIKAKQGKLQEAATLFQQAIRNGDRQTTTYTQLAKVLMESGNTAEAEEYLKRIDGRPDAESPLSAISTALAAEQGKYENAMELARKATEERPDEVGAWLLRAQTGLIAAEASSSDKPQRSELLKEVAESLNKSLQLAKTRPAILAVIKLRFEMRQAQGDTRAAREDIKAVLQITGLSPAERMLIAGRGYLALGDLGEARKFIEQSILDDRRNPDAHIAMADWHSAMDDPEQAIASLSNAYKLAPDNINVRERLALSVAMNAAISNSQLDWQQVDELIGEDSASTSSIMVRALVTLIQKSDNLTESERERLAARKLEAVTNLRELAKRAGAIGVSSRRLLASYYAQEWQQDQDGAYAASARENFRRAESFYRELLREDNPAAIDAYRLSTLLLLKAQRAVDEDKIGDAEDAIRQAELTLETLDELSGSSMGALRNRLHLARVRHRIDGDDKQLESAAAEIAQTWIEDAGSLKNLGQAKVWEMAGRTLSDMGFQQQSLVWLERIYEQDPRQYHLLVVGLAKAREFERAMELCLREYEKNPTEDPAVYVTEVVMLNPEEEIPGEVNDMIADAIAKYPDSERLLESIGTLHLIRQEYEKAVGLYERADAVKPDRIRTLNNLAIALTKVPMRGGEALEKIERAISRYGRMPELLDTLGIVLFRLNKLNEAEKVLREACSLSRSPAFRLHLIEVLMAANDSVAAHKAWRTIDLELADRTVFEPHETELLARFKQEFAPSLVE